MKKENVKELFRRRSVKVGSVVLAAAIVFGGGLWSYNESRLAVPELVSYVDTDGSIVIEEEETPLAAPKVTKSTKTKKKTKKIKMKKASKKTYTEKGKAKTKKSTKSQTTGNTKTDIETVVETKVDTKYKKGSDVKTQITTEKTTVTKTVTTQQAAAPKTTTTTASAASNVTGEVSVSSVASKADSRVVNAFTKMGFKITVNPSVSYSGLFDAKTKSITLKKADATVYHELGHYLAFMAGNYDMTSEFQGIFNREKSKYTAFNKSYVLANASEYFAESFKNYTEEPAALQASRPETYAAIQKALSNVTDAQVTKIMTVYRAVWG